jgi:UDP-N-acetylglucosamine transferase subunit ALG13
MIFLTVGTSFPFDRLVKAIDKLVGRGVLTEEFFAQVGTGAYIPRHFASVGALRKEDYDAYFSQAEAIVGHAGMGTITMALQQKKPILVMPRLKKYKELVNDHQLATAKRFEELGHVLAAYHVDELKPKLSNLMAFQPLPRNGEGELVSKVIGEFLRELDSNS